MYNEYTNASTGQLQELKHLETRQEQADYKKMVEQLFGIETKKGK